MINYFLVDKDKLIPKVLNFEDKIDNNKLLYALMDNTNLQSQLWTKIIKKVYFNNNFFKTNLSYCEDYQMLTHLAPKLNKISYLKSNLYYYIIRESSITKKIQLEKLITTYKVLLEERYDIFKKYCSSINNDFVKNKYIEIILYSCMEYLKKSKGNKEYHIYLKYRRYIRKNLYYIFLSKKLSLKQKSIALFISLGVINLILKLYK